MNHVLNNTKQKGFTMVELIIAMTFVSILLLIIASLIIQVTNTFTTGMTLREVNQTGRAISADIMRSVADSPQFDTSSKDYYFKTYGSNGQPSSARLCTGKHTYIVSYLGQTGVTNSSGVRIKFSRFDDPGAQLCIQSSSVPQVSRETNLLAAGDRELEVHAFDVSPTVVKDADSRQSIYRISFSLGTSRANSLDSQNKCRVPVDAKGEEFYCKINEFELVARAGGGL